MDPTICALFDGKKFLSFVQGEDRTFQVRLYDQCTGAGIDLSTGSAAVSVRMPRDGGGVLVRGSASTALTPSSFDATQTPAVVHLPGHGLVSGDTVSFTVGGGSTLPAPLVASTPYPVAYIDANSFSLGVNLTDTGSGTFMLTLQGGITMTAAASGIFSLPLSATFTAAVASGETQNMEIVLVQNNKLRVVLLPGGLDVDAQLI